MDAVGYTEKDGDCTIRFSNDELLVIFDWIAQSNQHENSELDSATQLIFEEFECLLESILAEPFDNDYRLLVRAAKFKNYPGSTAGILNRLYSIV